MHQPDCFAACNTPKPFFEAVGKPGVVSIEKRDEFGGRLADRRVARHGETTIRLPDDMHLWPARGCVPAQYGWTPVGTAIVHYDDRPVGVSLSQNALER